MKKATIEVGEEGVWKVIREGNAKELEKSGKRNENKDRPRNPVDWKKIE